MRYLVHASFDGANYEGFQRQLNGRTVENEIEKAFKNMTQIPTKINSSGRTDRGVHALALTFHFDTELVISNEKWLEGLNKRLPLDIRVDAIKEVAPNFHARHHALSRVYQYVIAKKPSTAFNFRYEVYIEDFNFDKATMCLNSFIGKKDFRGFSKASTNKISINVIDEIFKTHDRRLAGKTTAARGLYLKQVNY